MPEFLLRICDKDNLALLLLSTAALGGIIAYIYKHNQIIRDSKNKAITSIIKLLDEIEDRACEYWLSEFSSKDTKQCIFECTLKSKLQSLYNNSKHSSFKKDERKQIKKLVALLYRKVTEGSFEQVGRSPDKSRAGLISQECSDIKTKLSSMKIAKRPWN